MSTLDPSQLDLLPFGALLVTARFEIKFANRRALADLSTHGDACVGRALFDALPALGTKKLRAEIECFAGAPDGTGSHASIGVVPHLVPAPRSGDEVAHAGAEVHLVRVLAPAQDAADAPELMILWVDAPHVIGLARDVASLRATHRELDGVRDALFDALRQQSESMRRFAHHGRASVQAVNGVVDLLTAGTCTPEQRASLGLIAASIRQLDRLFTGILDPRSLSAGSAARRIVNGADLARSRVDVVREARSLEILLVEDNATNRRIVTALLKKRGHQVTGAANGREAVAALERAKFDLVLMDVAMPVMDGIDATKTIRSSQNGGRRRVPIVALTAHALETDRRTCLAAGMDDFLAKPIDVVELERVLACFAHEAAAGDPPSVAGVRERLEELGADADEAFLREALRDFASSTRGLVADLDARLAAADLPEVATLAHRLVGTALSLGARELADLARDLETSARDGRAEDARGARAKVAAEVGRVLEFCERLTREHELTAPAGPVPLD